MIFTYFLLLSSTLLTGDFYGHVEKNEKNVAPCYENLSSSIFEEEQSKKGEFDSYINFESKDGWELVFFEDFSGGSLNNKIWTASSRIENYNNELQVYNPKNVEIKGGKLLLIAKDEKKHSKKYTSGLIDSKGKVDFLYGKIEVKGKSPAGRGLFPAIWMLPVDEKNNIPQISIMEVVGHKPHLIYQVYYWREEGELKKIYNKIENTSFTEEYIYGIEWNESEIRWFINGQLVFTVNNNIPNMPLYLVINLAVGGDWPGYPDSNTVFPASFSIDYVKYYKKVGK